MWQQIEIAFGDAFRRVALAVAGFLPGILTMALVILFSLAVAFLVRFALRKLLAGIDFDRRVHRWGLTATAEWTPRNAPTHVVAHAGFWFVLLVGFLAGLSALDTRVTDALAMRTLGWLPDLVGGLAIFVVGLVVARFLERTTLINAVNMRIQAARLISLGVKWLALLCATALALQHMQVGGTVLVVSFAVVFGGIVLGLALALGLGSREAVSRGWERQLHEEKRTAEDVDEIRHM